MYRLCVVALFILTALGFSQALAQDEGLRDPTRPLNHRAADSGEIELQLNSILIGQDRKLAIINGQQLRENELIKGTDGTRVRSIESQVVVLQQGAKVWRLRLGGAAIRRTAPTEN